MSYRYAALSIVLGLWLSLTPQSARPFEAPGRFVTDMAGRKVLIPQKVERVLTVGGTPAVNAFILAIGKGQTIKNGRPAVMARNKRWKYQFVFAPFLANQPVVSTSEASVWTPNLEVIAALPHDLIFVDSELTARMLEKKGFTAFSLNWNDPECIGKTMAIMGDIFNERGRAREFEQYYLNNVSKVSALISPVPQEKRPQVLYVRTNPAALIMPSTASHLIAAAGGRYAVKGAPPANGTFSPEHLIAWDPDVLLVGGPDEVEHIYREKQYSQLKAVRNKRVHVVPVAAHVWTNYTPEQAIAVLWLAKLLYPYRFKHINMKEEMRYFYARFFGYRLKDSQIDEILTQRIR